MLVALRRVSTLVACGAVPAFLLYQVTIGQATRLRPERWHYAIDFHHVWLGAREFVHGRAPYPPPDALFADRWLADHVFAYPPPVAAVLAPLGLLPYPVAAGVFTVVLLGALGGALRLLGVRDWRCYGIAFACPAVMTAVSVGTLTPLLALAVAATWRYRNSWRACAAWLAVAVTMKLFLWPVAVWLFLTGRRRAAVVGLGAAAVATALAWGAVGFEGARDYPALVRNLAEIQSPHGYSAARFAGPGLTLAAAALVLVALAALLTRRVPGADRAAFAGAVVLSVALSPIAWLHYFALVVILVALWSPKMSAAWLVPLALWLTPWQHAGGGARVALAWAIAVGALAAAAWQSAGLRQSYARIQRVVRLDRLAGRAPGREADATVPLVRDAG